MEPTSENDRSWVAYAILAGLVFVLAFGLAIVPAIILFFVLRRFTNRWEATAILAVSLAYLVLFFPVWPGGYFLWLPTLVGWGDTSLPVPWQTLLAFTGVSTSVLLLVDGTKLTTWVPNKFAKDPKLDPILPTEKEKQQAKNSIVTAPGGALLPSARHRSLYSAEAPGSRSFPIGLDKRGVPVLLHEYELRTHGLLFGSTGSGKTETIKVIAGGLLDLGWSGMILDLKEDARGLLDWCQTYADYHAMPFQHFRLSDPDPSYWFNVLYGMGPDEARDTIVGSQTFEAPYYENLNKKQLGQLVTLLYSAHQVDPVKYALPTVYDIGKILAARDLPAATRETVAAVIGAIPSFNKDDFHTLVSPTKEFIDTAAGLGARLTSMYETQVGRLVLRPSGSRPEFDVAKPGLGYVGLDSMGKPELTSLVSASVLRRMAVYAADRTSGKLSDTAPRFLIVDEANFVNRRLLLELLSRARSAGIACLVCTQGPTDWQARAQGEPDLTSLVQNTNVAVIMSQGERTNAELCADIIGRTEKTVVTQRVQDGIIMEDGTMSKTVDYLVSPDALRSLTIGEAIVRVGKPQEWQRWVTIRPRDPRATAN